MKVIEYLKRLGLTSYQARLLAHVLANGPSTASDISARTKIPYTKVYEIVHSLQNQGFLRCFRFERPKRYQAETLANITKSIVVRHEREIRDLRDFRTQSVAGLKLPEQPELELPELETLAKR